MSEMLKFYWKPNCTTCRKARSLLREMLPGGENAFQEIDLDRGLSEAELDKLIGNRDYLQFLNTRNQLYRDRGMKQNPPSRADAIRLMSQHPNLIKRPILIQGAHIVVGCDQEAMAELVSRNPNH
jgi:arsenate reductase-like glutaredoxin family protein